LYLVFFELTKAFFLPSMEGTPVGVKRKGG